MFEDLEPHQKAEVVERTYSQRIKELMRSRVCANCGITFNEMANIGQYACVWHPGRCVLGEWSCCGDREDEIDEISQRSSGCCACDHTETAFNPVKRDTIELAIALALYLQTPRTSFQREEPVDKTDLYRKCWIPRATSNRVKYRKRTNMSFLKTSVPANELDTLRQRFELQDKAKSTQRSIYVNAMVGHFAPMMYN